MNQGLEIVPVINKVDLPSARPEEARRQVEDILTIPAQDAVLASGKSGIGIDDIFAAIIKRVPAPRWADYPQHRALVFDSSSTPTRASSCYVRVFSGTFKAGQTIELMFNGVRSVIKEVGVFSPKMKPQDELGPGSVGYIVINIREVADVKVGDTITLANDPAKEPVPGFKEVRPMVFSGIYPLDTADYEKLKASLGKLAINDSSLTYTAESFSRPRLRLPLRLPRPAPHGDRPGAPASRVRPRHPFDLPVRRLQGLHDRRQGAHPR
jgi:GTP-binding protein LepA